MFKKTLTILALALCSCDEPDAASCEWPPAPDSELTCAQWLRCYDACLVSNYYFLTEIAIVECANKCPDTTGTVGMNVIDADHEFAKSVGGGWPLDQAVMFMLEARLACR